MLICIDCDRGPRHSTQRRKAKARHEKKKKKRSIEEQRQNGGWVEETNKEKNIINDIKDLWQRGSRE